MNNLARYRFTSAMIIIAAFAFFSYAFSTGITGRTLKNGDGCTCHNPSANAAVSVVIAGPATLAPGAEGTYTVTITGGTLTAAGTNIAASSGTLVNSGNDLKVSSGELTHTQPKGATGGSVIFTFKYTAPANTGTATLFANGNSVNLNGSSAGDSWNFATNFVVNIAPTGINDESGLVNSFRLEQNYPNPFNPETTIGFTLPEAAFVTLKIYSLLGQEVMTATSRYMSNGYHAIPVDASLLNSGTYIYRLEAVNGNSVFRDTKKMVVLK